MKNIIIALLIIGLLIGTTACALMTQKISEVKTADKVGKTVTVSGIVQSSFKIGTLSGYTVKDYTDTIGVSTQNLPKENTTVTVTGTLMKDSLFGYYIKANK